MNQPNPIDEAIARCDVILANIDRIQSDIRDAAAKAQAALQDAINKCRELDK